MANPVKTAAQLILSFTPEQVAQLETVVEVMRDARKGPKPKAAGAPKRKYKKRKPKEDTPKQALNKKFPKAKATKKKVEEEDVPDEPEGEEEEEEANDDDEA